MPNKVTVRHRRVVEGLQQRKPLVASNRCACPTLSPCVSSLNAPISTRSPSNATEAAELVEVCHGRVVEGPQQRPVSVEQMRLPDRDAPRVVDIAPISTRSPESFDGDAESVDDVPSGRRRSCSSAKLTASNRCACSTYACRR